MKTIWYRIVQWCQENLTRARYEVIAEAITSPPFDWSYLLRLERVKLREMKSYFELTNGTFDHTNDIRWIGICIKLLDIIIEEPEEHPYINTRNMWRFVNGAEFAKDVVKQDVEHYYKSYPQDLRWVKAYHLYYEIRKQYTYRWWD
jgi:hypothetical protein